MDGLAHYNEAERWINRAAMNVDGDGRAALIGVGHALLALTAATIDAAGAEWMRHTPRPPAEGIEPNWKAPT